MLTTSDFICLIYFYRLHGSAVEALEKLSIRSWHKNVISAVDADSENNLTEADQAIVKSFRDRAGAFIRLLLLRQQVLYIIYSLSPRQV